MVLVDTSVWIDHLRSGNPELSDLLNQAEVAIHPFVIGELALGNLTRRAAILGLLRQLPKADLASDHHVHHMIEDRLLIGRGIGWVDAHLLASALLSNVAVWTFDRRQSAIARELGIAWT